MLNKIQICIYKIMIRYNLKIAKPKNPKLVGYSNNITTSEKTLSQKGIK